MARTSAAPEAEQAVPALPKIPEKLGACADLLYKTQQERYALQHKVDAPKELETALSEKIIRELPKSEATGVAGKRARATVRTKEVPQVADWPALYAYITKTKSFDLLQKRVADKSIAERWDAGKNVPGVTKFTKVTVSITKV